MKNKTKNLLIVILSVMLSLFAVMGLTACGGGDGDGGSSNTVTVNFDMGYMPSDGNRTIVKSISTESTYQLSGLGISTVREGYDFLGFYDSATAGVQIFNASGQQLHNLTQNATLYAQWQTHVYEKSFITGNDLIADVSTLASKEIEIGDEIMSLPEPKMSEGYDFIGWAFENENGTLISDGTSVKSDYIRVGKNGNGTIWLNDTPLYAVTKIHSYTLTLRYNNGTGDTEEKSIVYNTAVENLPILEDDEETCREFVGWSTSATVYVDYKNDADYNNVKMNLELYAFWDMYKIVNFYMDDKAEEGIPVKVYKQRDGLDDFSWPDIENPGKELIGWYRNKLYNTSKLQTLSYSDGIKSVYGKWEIITYKITFDLNGGKTVEGGKTELPDIEYTVESEKSLETLVKDRYTFKGWYRGGDETKTTITSIKPGTYGNLNLIAKFQGDDRKVIYHAGIGNVPVDYKLVEYDAEYRLDVPVCDGYGFFGWYLDEDLTIQLTDYDGYGISSKKWTSYDEETEVYAKFLEKRYITVTHSCLDAGTVEIKEHYVAGEKVRIEVVTASQYTVEGIELNGTKVSENNVYEFTMPASNVSIHVVYDPVDYLVTLSVGENVYCSKTQQTIGYGEFYILPVAYKEGHKFVGWEYSDGISSELITNGNGESKSAYLYTTNATLTPFFIADANNKDVIVKSVNDFLDIKNNPSATYQLVANINLTGRDWQPFDFSGTLNGNGYTITNLSIETDEDINLAMFNTLSGTVSNLNFNNLRVVSGSYEHVSVGGIAVTLTGTISNVNVLSGVVTADDGTTGGFVAILNGGTIKNSTNNAPVTSFADADGRGTGGFVGYSYGGTITNCENNGDVSGKKFTAGFVGRTSANATLTLGNLTNNGDILSEGAYVGGIVGYYDRVRAYSLGDFTNTGSVMGTTHVGGIFGRLSNSYVSGDNSARIVNLNKLSNSGNITGTGNYVGGIFGSIYTNASNSGYSKYYDGTQSVVMREFVNTGDITGNIYVGGLIGEIQTDTISTELISGVSSAKITATAYVGGVIGVSTNLTATSPSNIGTSFVLESSHVDGSNRYAFVGGYIGIANNTNISDATNNTKIIYGDVTCTGDYLGGICAQSSGTFKNCYNEGEIYAPNSNYVGGICGNSNKGYAFTNQRLSNTANITAISQVGGIYGRFTNSYVSGDNSNKTVNLNVLTNSGNIVGTGNYIGGIIGYVYTDAANSGYSNYYEGMQSIVGREFVNNGDISGINYVGGIMGYIRTDSSTTEIIKPKSISDVRGVAYMGGMIGYSENLILTSAETQGSTIISSGAYIDGSNKYAYIGGFVGLAQATNVVNAINTVEIDYSTTDNTGNYIGGICGKSSGTFTNCENQALINAPNSSYVGGICGYNDKAYGYTSKELKNTSDIIAISNVGGIFGRISNTYVSGDNNIRTITLTKLENTGTITASGDNVGGIIGSIYTDASNSGYSNYYEGQQCLMGREIVNTGNVKGNYYVGGIIGYGSTDCYTTELISPVNNSTITGVSYVGGMMGYSHLFILSNATTEGTTINCTGAYIDGSTKYAYLGGYVGKSTETHFKNVVNTVEINYSGSDCLGSYVGGIAGTSTGTFTNCKNLARVYAPNSNYVGGITGYQSKLHAYTLDTLENTGDVTGLDYVSGLFGRISNNYVSGDNASRFVICNNFTNSGNIVGVNKVGGLIGQYDADASNSGYSKYYDGQQGITVKEASNSGTVTGTDYVGGLFGRIANDNTASEVLSYTQTGEVIGTSNTNGVVGSITNLILPAVSEE